MKQTNKLVSIIIAIMILIPVQHSLAETNKNIKEIQRLERLVNCESVSKINLKGPFGDKFSYSIGCELKTISWVEMFFDIESNYLTGKKTELEKYIRYRIGNDISWLKHSTISFNDSIRIKSSKNEIHRRTSGTLGCELSGIEMNKSTSYRIICILSPSTSDHYNFLIPTIESSKNILIQGEYKNNIKLRIIKNSIKELIENIGIKLSGYR